MGYPKVLKIVPKKSNSIVCYFAAKPIVGSVPPTTYSFIIYKKFIVNSKNLFVIGPALLVLCPSTKIGSTFSAVLQPLYMKFGWFLSTTP